MITSPAEFEAEAVLRLRSPFSPWHSDFSSLLSHFSDVVWAASKFEDLSLWAMGLVTWQAAVIEGRVKSD